MVYQLSVPRRPYLRVLSRIRLMPRLRQQAVAIADDRTLCRPGSAALRTDSGVVWSRMSESVPLRWRRWLWMWESPGAHRRRKHVGSQRHPL